MSLRWNGNVGVSKGGTRWNRVFVVVVVSMMVMMMMMMEGCEGFGNFQMPKFEFPKFGNNDGSTSSSLLKNKNGGALEAGDTIAVIGASGNVGKLVALRLSDTYNVNGIVRDASSVESFFEGRKDRITLFETDLLSTSMSTSDENNEVMREALENANAIVICTGTTAFPTKAWTKSGEEQVAGDVWKALVDNSFSISDAISSLDEQGLNTPNNVDDKSNQSIVQSWSCKRKKRIIMLSSIGVTRRETMPFPILNACGVLSAKAAGEDAIIQSAKDNGYSYTIVRPGQLFGGPYDNNYYLGTLFQLDKDAATQDVTCQQGDTLLGDTLRSTLAEVTAQICEGNYANNMDFAVVNTKGDTPSLDTLQQRLSSL